MQIRFQELTLKSFKSHQDLNVKFGDSTQITGDNAKGKSSILDAVVWTLYGTDVLGRKLDPFPLTYEADETNITLLFSLDGKEVKLGRSLKKGKTSYHINDVPSKAGDFNEIVDNLGGKELFLSLFNPSHFFAMHWEKQRAMVLQFVTAPANKEVLKQLPELQSDKLAGLVKKHSLEDLQKIHKDQKTKLEKEHIAAQSRTQTLNEQLENYEVEGNYGELTAEEQRLTDAIREADKKPAKAWKIENERRQLQSDLDSIQNRIDQSKAKWPDLKNESVPDTCRTCKQPLDDESVKAVETDKEKRIEEFKAEHKQLVEQKKELSGKLAGIEPIDAEAESQKVRDMEKERDGVTAKIRKFEERQRLQQQVTEAEQNEKETRENLNESICILDAIKAFYATEADLQAQKVQGLFETLSIRLFNELKNGELKATFEIEMDEKPYRELSLSECIRAGLELRDVLSEQGEIITPCFVDNAESISRFKEPNGQLVTSRVVTGEELEVTADE
ncbi:ATPase [Salibacterium salarium]|uniref:Nuclease SbcCD subunit C n=1 Tax=Salibacterium salarium TaxID=284579 RepID=A0A428N2F6_9BACI|nr:ATPase [Salibacterium salarium]RSL32644.1 ATPase [Salibacterium salarium]